MRHTARAATHLQHRQIPAARRLHRLVELRHLVAVLIRQRRNVGVLQVRIPIDDAILLVVGAQLAAVAAATTSAAAIGRRVQRLLLQHQPHLVRCLALGDFLALALTHLVVLEHDARNRELALVRQSHLHFRFVRGRRPTAHHALFLQPADRVAGHLVVVHRRSDETHDGDGDE